MSKKTTTILLKAKEFDHPDYGKIRDGEMKLEGLIRHPTTESKGQVYDFPSFTFPEFGPARYFCSHEYQIPKEFVVEITGRRWKIRITTKYDDGIPESVEASFQETTTKETPFTIEKPRGTVSYAFGQPNFIQSEMFPHRNGKCACLLACIESGWGDAGNQNVFLLLDETGTPAELFHEFSCC